MMAGRPYIPEPQSSGSQDVAKWDFIPPLQGPNVLPYDIMFHALVQWAASHNGIAVRDLKTGHVATYQQLLSDVVGLRNRIREELDSETLQALREEKDVPFLIWSDGYEFMVAYFAVHALGGVAVPISLHITVKECIHISTTVRAVVALTNKKYISPATEAGKQAHSSVKSFKVIETTPWLMRPQWDIRDLCFEPGRIADQNQNCLVIFTSGSTGPPKGVALRRYTFYANVLNTARTLELDRTATFLQFLPMHHLLGLSTNTLPVLMAGGSVEFTKGAPSFLWNRFLQGGIPVFCAVPTVYVRLLNYWRETISLLPEETRESYRKSIASIRTFFSSSAPLPHKVAEGWLELTNRPILDRYGATETSMLFLANPKLKFRLGSVGVKNPVAEVKLTEGDRGEVLARSPFVLMKYVNDSKATRDSYDADGFFKTGDIARLENGQYFIEGRSSIDILKSGGYKISALDVEQQILRHPKVAEAMVVGVADDEYGQCIAAAVVLHNPEETLTLTELRDDLRSRLSNYRLPTMLRVVSEFPKTDTMKVQKKKLRETLFGNPSHPDIQRWTKKVSQMREARL